MTTLDRTAYPRFARTPSPKELRKLYTPSPSDLAFVARSARGTTQKFALMVLLKVFQRLGYFPNPEAIPDPLIAHIRTCLSVSEQVVPDIASPVTLYRYHALIRDYLEVNGDGKYIRHVAAKAIMTAVQVMDGPADLINVAIETLIAEQCELPLLAPWSVW